MLPAGFPQAAGKLSLSDLEEAGVRAYHTGAIASLMLGRLAWVRQVQT